MSGPFDELELEVIEAARAARDELVGFAAELVAYDTTARDGGQPPRDEAALQAAVARRLAAAGGEIDLWEAETTEAGDPYGPPASISSGGRSSSPASRAPPPAAPPTPPAEPSTQRPDPFSCSATSTPSTSSRESGG